MPIAILTAVICAVGALVCWRGDSKGGVAVCLVVAIVAIGRHYS